jgi:hypothetical protein
LAEIYRATYRKPLSSLPRSIKVSTLGWNKHVNSRARLILKGQHKRKVILEKLDLRTKTAVMTARLSKSILLDGLVPNRTERWMSPSARLKSPDHRSLEVENFSFFAAPKSTMTSLAAIAKADAECVSGRINFLDHDCLDIGPWLVLAVMRQEMLPIFNGGAIGDQLSAVIKALRLNGPLRFGLGQTYSDPNEIWAFPLRSRRPAGTSRSPTMHLDPQSSEEVAFELCDQIDNWLQQSSSLELSPEGRRIVGKIVGETLDNAQRHSRPDFPNDGDWSISGYMRRQGTGEGQTFICQMAFLSVGAPISTTVNGCVAATKRQMDEYVASHLSSFPNQLYADEHLRTIYALQDRVSGDANAVENGRGGTGFRDIITFFGDLAAATSTGVGAKLAIVSGRTCLHIDANYCEVSRPARGQEFNIWMNAQNLKEIPPDSSSMVELDQEFRGTLITISLELDKGYLENADHD